MLRSLLIEVSTIIAERADKVHVHSRGELTVGDGCPLVNRPLSEVEFKGNQGFLIVGIRRVDGSIVLSPHPTTTLYLDDTVIVLGRNDDIPQLATKFELQAERIMYRGARL